MLTRRTKRQIAVLGSLLLLPAVAPSAAPIENGGIVQTTIGAPIPLTVRNDNFYDVHVYAWRGGEYQSLGLVMSFTSERFEVPERLTAAGADFRLLADPIGGAGAYVSEPIIVSPDQRLELTVRNAINLSTVVVR